MTSTAAAYDTGAASHPIAHCSGRVVDAIAAVAGTPAWSMTPNEQRTALVDLTRAQARLCELRLRVLASGGERGPGGLELLVELCGEADVGGGVGPGLSGRMREPGCG